ncbi:hypothetical protein SAMN06272721_11050 [Arthrobacter sp. P2b]|nr:hypothetical protein SAMN06272721_11050 [Arthrobacter sp. P2b]
MRLSTKGVGSLYASALPKHDAEKAIVDTYAVGRVPIVRMLLMSVWCFSL